MRRILMIETNPTFAGATRMDLLVVLSELVRTSSYRIPTTALVYVMRMLGHSADASRQAISRASQDEWIIAEKRGRTAYWNLSEVGLEVVADWEPNEVQKIVRDDANRNKVALLIVTVPAELRPIRRPLYSALRKLGYGLVEPGLWVSPDVASVSGVRELVHRFALQESVIGFVGTIVDVGLAGCQIFDRAWNLDLMAARYDQFISEFESAQPVSGEEFLAALLRLSGHWRELRSDGATLCDYFLIDHSQRASVLYRKLHARWSPEALGHWDAINRLARSSALSI